MQTNVFRIFRDAIMNSVAWSPRTQTLDPDLDPNPVLAPLLAYVLVKVLHAVVTGKSPKLRSSAGRCLLLAVKRTVCVGGLSDSGLNVGLSFLQRSWTKPKRDGNKSHHVPQRVRKSDPLASL
jgi:hypothetical protein